MVRAGWRELKMDSFTYTMQQEYISIEIVQWKNQRKRLPLCEGGIKLSHKSQISLNLPFVIPDNKPDIERILRVTSTPDIEKTAVIPAKIILTGQVNLFMEYIACSHLNNQPIHCAEFQAPFTQCIDNRRAKPCYGANVSTRVEFQEVQLVDRRTIRIFIIIEAILLKFERVKAITKSHTATSPNINNKPMNAVSLYTVDCSLSQPCSYSNCQDDS